MYMQRSTPYLHTLQLRMPLLLMWLCIAFAIYLRLLHLHLPFDRDEGEYAYAAQRILKGDIPYVDFANMKFPGLYYVYAAVFSFGADEVVTIRITTLFIFLVSAALIFFIAKTWWNTIAAAYAVIFFTCMQHAAITQGLYANAEVFVLLFALTAFALILYDRHSKWYLPALSGLCVAAAVLIKQQGITFAVCTFFALLYTVPKAWRWRAVLYWIAGAGVLPIVLICVWWQQGALSQVYFFTFRYAGAYADLVPRALSAYLFTSNASVILRSIYAFVLLAGLGMCMSLFALRNARVQLFWIFILCSALAIMPGGYFRIHYFLFLYPACALAGAYACLRIQGWVWRQKPVGLFLVPALMLFMGNTFVHVPESVRWTLQHDSTTLTRHLHPYAPFADAPRIGAYIRERTSENDTLGMIGNEPELYVYSERAAATTLMYAYPLVENTTYTDDMLAQFIGELEANAPEMMIITDISYTGPNKAAIAELYTWWSEYKVHYDSLTTFCTNAAYTPYFQPDGISQTCGKRSEIYIYLRKQ